MWITVRHIPGWASRPACSPVTIPAHSSWPLCVRRTTVPELRKPPSASGARQQGRKEILVAALEGQMSGLLLDYFPRDIPVRPLRINSRVLSIAFGGKCVLGDPWPEEPLKQKGGLVHV